MRALSYFDYSDDIITILMVYIKLGEILYQKIKDYIVPSKLVTCQKNIYIAYPQFKRISFTYNLPIHKDIGRQDLITYSQMDQLIQREKQTPQQKRLIQELKNKRELRLLKQISPNRQAEDYYFQSKQSNSSIKEMTDTISFSMAFIFTFFMAGLTGYYVGAYFLSWTLASSLMLSLTFIVITLFVQTTLFIIKQNRTDTQKKEKLKQNTTNYGRTQKQQASSSSKKKNQ